MDKKPKIYTKKFTIWEPPKSELKPITDTLKDFLRGDLEEWEKWFKE